MDKQIVDCQKILYLKFGELCLKGKNRKEFSNKLISNIKRALSDFNNIEYHFRLDSTILTNIDQDDFEAVLDIVKQIFGIVKIVIGYQISKDVPSIFQASSDFVNRFKNEAGKEKITFKVEVKRTDKTFVHPSNEFKVMIASHLLSNHPYLSVDVLNPDLLLKVEIKNDYAIIFNVKIDGASGLPVGSNGHCLSLLSGGIDSPVASKLAMKRGLSIDFITFITPPHTSELALNKVIELAKKVVIQNRLCNASLYVVNFTKILDELTHIENESYKITLMRRCFFRIAERLAKRVGAHCLVTGEAIGQVASQTIESLSTIEEVLTDLIVIRPLIAFDKKEIIDLAIKYDTYATSILPYDDSCSLFAPKNPATKPKKEKARAYESKLLMLETLIDHTLKKEITKVKLNEKR
ncbi:tRNA uracil 4-sulfurtransferase ThiI [Ureaplasma canigenitalium]|uniref:tRNA uracil 4-sulfurtransferase ThiI n=1 Tax=Ureaplasma canigenitalium TaxID=42092 RepID=UPI0004E0ED83|nr:tRNA uracil 4-sulfurtransferase ThiI [Ureaplasma canigenitalium]